jgi:hypothetical protein
MMHEVAAPWYHVTSLMQVFFDTSERQRLVMAWLRAGVLVLMACLAVGLAACGGSDEMGTLPAASQGEESVLQQLPALDVNTPQQFQTASFAYG